MIWENISFYNLVFRSAWHQYTKWVIPVVVIPGKYNKSSKSSIHDYVFFIFYFIKQ